MSDTALFIYTDDYLARTLHLTAREHGALLLLLTSASQRGGWLPVDGPLAHIAGVGRRSWEPMWDAISEFWVERDERLYSTFLERWADRRRREFARPAIPAAIKAAVRDRDGNCCVYCGSTDGPFHFDHVMPFSRGGDHSVENLAIACASCNMSKGAYTLDEWRPQA